MSEMEKMRKALKDLLEAVEDDHTCLSSCPCSLCMAMRDAKALLGDRKGEAA